MWGYDSDCIGALVNPGPLSDVVSIQLPKSAELVNPDVFWNVALPSKRPAKRLPGRDGVSGDRLTMSRYHAVVSTRQTTIRLPGELADQAEAIARVRGISMNAVIVDALAMEVERVRTDKEFTARAKRLLERDKRLLDRLAR